MPLKIACIPSGVTPKPTKHGLLLSPQRVAHVLANGSKTGRIIEGCDGHEVRAANQLISVPALLCSLGRFGFFESFGEGLAVLGGGGV
jgi:hypothetical protein